MKAGEVVRIIVFSFLGFLLMFFIQPWIYQNRIIRVSDVAVEDWLQDYYTTGASIVFASSIIATVVWYVMAAKAKVPGASDTDKWRVVWWLFLLLPILSICLGISVFNPSKDALVSLTGFYILDALFLLYWLPTATSSPGSLMFIPPGAFLLRRLIGA
jgi:hypothetical protein